MRHQSLAVVAFAVTLVHTTHSLTTSDSETDSISLPARVRPYNGSLGDVRGKLLVGADEGARGEARMLDIKLDPAVRFQVSIMVKSLHRCDPPGVREGLQQIDQQAVELKLSMQPGPNDEKIEQLKAIVQYKEKDRNGDTLGVQAARADWEMVHEDQKKRKQEMQQHDLRPDELIKMVILEVKIKAALVRVSKKTGKVLTGPRPNPVAGIDFISLGHLEDCIEKYNEKHKKAFTLAGTLWDYFGNVRDIVSFVSMVNAVALKKIHAGDVVATHDLLVKGWQQVAVRLSKPMSQEDVLKDQNVVSLFKFTLALGTTIPLKRQEILDCLTKVFGVPHADLLIKEVDKVVLNPDNLTNVLGEKEGGVNSKIVDRLLPSKRTPAVLAQGTENQMPKRFKKSNAANSSPLAEESNAANSSPSAEKSDAANSSPSVVESSAAYPSPSVRPVPVLLDLFVR
uniref:RxLR effector candidate protein n=1 Tax=Peronospora matthiolae TaxID=2874970 RepID=A0AAV1T239_9STRA